MEALRATTDVALFSVDEGDFTSWTPGATSGVASASWCRSPPSRRAGSTVAWQWQGQLNEQVIGGTYEAKGIVF
jgi:hypothetical protein